MFFHPKLVLVVFLTILIPFCRADSVCPEPQGADEESCTTGADNKGTALVTGANGYIASWIVKELLAQGYTVHAAVRDATDPRRVDHLQQLVVEEEETADRLKIFSTGNLGAQDASSVWDAPLQGCHAVFHVSMAMGWHDGWNGMYNPTLEGTRQLLAAIEKHSSEVKALLLTSSMAAVAVQREGIITDESHWRNAEEDANAGSWYSATKIAQEQLVTQWAQDKQQTLPPDFKFVSICPTRVLGPPIQTNLPIEGLRLNQLREWLQHPPAEENETMELVHVQDVALLHIAALENPKSNGRYLCVDESWHWNEFLDFLQAQYSEMPPAKRYQGAHNKVPPKQFDPSRRQSLGGVPFRSMAQLLQESVEYLKARGELGDLTIL